MMTTSAFEILGPIMVGPSSSHTAGALRIALVASSVAPAPVRSVRFVLINSFSHTYRGHGSDKALVAGMLGLATDDLRVRDSFELAAQAGLSFEFVEAGDDPGRHPNTVCVEMHCDDGTPAGINFSVEGESLGGGRIRIARINNVPVTLTGEMPTLLVAHRDVPGVLANLTSQFSQVSANIATISTYRTARGGMAYTIIEADDVPTEAFIGRVRQLPQVTQACLVRVPGTAPTPNPKNYTLNFDFGSDLLKLCARHHASIGQIMRERECELSAITPDTADKNMRKVLLVMQEESTATLESPERSLGGLLFGQAKRVAEAPDALKAALMGSAMTDAVSYAMATLERSATMGVMVAAPTAGAAGVVPGTLLGVAKHLKPREEALLDSLWCAAAVGGIIARNASVAGAEGGCQAEVGTAAAMAAAGLVSLLGGTPEQALNASSIAIANLLGLVCDPVRGLVEFPCQDRNAIGVANAISAAQLSLSGVGTPIPFDEVVAAMDSVGRALPYTLRETALGGLAAAPSSTNAQAPSSSLSPCASCMGCN